MMLKALLRKIHSTLPVKIKSYIANFLGLYPRTVGNEVKAVKKVLGATSWNMSYSITGKHIQLEREFANYIGAENAIAVGSGGVGLQMITRALGLDSQSEVIMQVDTCSAVPQAILNAHTIPVMADVNIENFQFSLDSVASNITKNTKMIVATHMWGNPENLKGINTLTKNKNIHVIEDACLALGGKIDGKFLGSISLAGVFSFGSTKPVQAGEGGMIVTNNDDLAKELRSLRGWGDRETEYGVRDVSTLSWNGRMPEVIAAIALEQLKGYPRRLAGIQDRVLRFRKLVAQLPDFKIVPQEEEQDLSYTQLSIKITPNSRYSKRQFFQICSNHRVGVFHANFEPLTELTLFRSGNWQKWINSKHKLQDISPSDFRGAYEIYNDVGLGFTRSNFESERNYRNLEKFIGKNFS